MGMTQREISQYVVTTLHLKHKAPLSSSEISCTCPFHKDGRPSLFISMEKGLFNCFSCQRKGSIARLYYLVTNRRLYEDLNIENNEFLDFATYERVPIEQQDFSIIPDVQFNIEGQFTKISNSDLAIDYLLKRKMSLSVLENQFKAVFAESVHINGTFFRNRLVIPTYENGNVVMYEGRDCTGTAQPKVLYAKNSYRQTLFDIDKLDTSKPLFLVEGLMDLAILREDPYFANSTAVFGVGINERQIWLLNKFKEVIIIPDNDDPGMSVISLLNKKYNGNLSVLEVPRVCKDLGEVPIKLSISVEALRTTRNWLDKSLTRIKECKRPNLRKKNS